MTKPTQATIFRKRQILPAGKLTQAIQEYGSVDGVVPYKADGTQDSSMSAPLGTKTAPFGNAHFKGFNMYTQLEVQQLVETGVLGADDRFVFWNLDTNNLSAWNGTEIIHLGGNSGGGSMDYLFGNGSDGDVTMVSDGSYDTVKNFTNFTLNSGVTLTKLTAGSPLVIKCTGTCTLNGVVNLNGKGFVGQQDSAGKGYSGISGISSINYAPSGSFDKNITFMLASLLHFDSLAIMGGAGAGVFAQHTSSSNTARSYTGGFGAASGGNSHAASSGSSSDGKALNYAGGNGGGGLLVIARKIVINAAVFAKGLDGASGSSNGAVARSGGGGGGCAIFVANKIEDNGTYDFTGGAAGGTYAGAGGTGGYVTVII